MSEESAALDGTLRVARRHYPRRDDAVATWLKAERDKHSNESPGVPGYWALDALLDQYRERADFGAPLDAEPAEEYGYEQVPSWTGKEDPQWFA